jgi:hypothetical protein
MELETIYKSGSISSRLTLDESILASSRKLAVGKHIPGQSSPILHSGCGSQYVLSLHAARPGPHLTGVAEEGPPGPVTDFGPCDADATGDDGTAAGVDGTAAGVDLTGGFAAGADVATGTGVFGISGSGGWVGNVASDTGVHDAPSSGGGVQTGGRVVEDLGGREVEGFGVDWVVFGIDCVVFGVLV